MLISVNVSSLKRRRKKEEKRKGRRKIEENHLPYSGPIFLYFPRQKRCKSSAWTMNGKFKKVVF